MLVVHVLAAMILVALALYAQYRIPLHTAGWRKALLSRGVLAAVGVLLGMVWARQTVDPALSVLAFAQGFGAAHVPAAFILFFKRARQEGPS